VWTGLASNWKEKQKSDFSIPEVVRYLETLEDASRAREYIQNAPSQIQTAAREAIREQLRWNDAKLSPVLFVVDQIG
jgi:plasmid stabilization system protein ParE